MATIRPNRKLDVVNIGPPTCLLLNEYRRLRDGGRHAGSDVATAIDETLHLCAEARSLASVGTFVSGIREDDELVWSRECYPLFGIEEVADLRVGALLACVHADDLATVRTARQDAFASGTTYDIHYRILHPSVSIRWIHERATVVAPGTPQAKLMGVVQDVTNDRTSKSALRAAEDQLRQAQKMEAVGRLAGGVAHDFNNLLSVILSYAELVLADLEPGEPMHDDVEQIRAAGNRAADLTRQLLLFSRQQVVEPTVLDLNALLKGMEKMLRRILGEDVELASLQGSAPLHVKADTSSLEQVIMNLAVNARDAMHSGGRLTMETAATVLEATNARGLPPGPYAVVTVTDTGAGMDQATVSHIFEPFFTTKDAGHGTGLGLSTVFGIMQASGGSVSVASKPGAGATFTLHLPLIDAPVEPRPHDLLRGAARGSETILLVEDEDHVRAVAAGILRRHGYQVLEARNAGEALLTCEKFQGDIHLLVTDVVMPQMTGVELAGRLSGLRPAMKVLCMSGYTSQTIRSQVAGSRIAYLQKPITVTSLTEKVRDVLAGAPARIDA